MKQSVRNFARALATNANTSSFPSKVPTITEPTNDGVVAIQRVGLPCPTRMKLMFLGLGANDDAYSCRVLGWTRVQSDGKTDIWIPVILDEFAVILGNCPGVAGAAVLDTEFLADTITPVANRIEDRVIGAGTALNSDTYILSPANDTPGHVIINIEGFEKIEFTFDQTTNTPTMNVLYANL